MEAKRNFTLRITKRQWKFLGYITKNEGLENSTLTGHNEINSRWKLETFKHDQETLYKKKTIFGYRGEEKQQVTLLNEVV